MKRTALMTLAAAMVFAAPAWCSRELSYVDILRRLTDLDRLMYWQEGFQAGQASSYDRGEHRYWGANGDAGKYIRVEPNGEAVMAEIKGPGCIYRIWSANPQGKIRFYFDGASKPQLEVDLNEMFTGKIPPFDKPLVYKRGPRFSASDCYLPIPFAKSVKITADRPYGQYYQFTYVLFPKDCKVPTFRLPLNREERAALEAVKKAWTKAGADPKPKLPGQTTVRKTFTIQPQQTVVLAELRGPGIIRALRAHVDCKQRYFWRKLLLRGVWDGAQWPQVLSPLGPFFGFDWYTATYSSLVAGSDPFKGCYFYYPMPFRRSARLELTSYLSMPATITFEVEWAPVDKLPDNAMYFFARWRHEPHSSTFDYPFIETAGRGWLVGVTLQIDHPVPGWWGEGDEKVWVDDDRFPRWIGTGSEDYFGDAWGIRYLSGPSWGCSLGKNHRTCPYRWHFADFVPFAKRLRMTIENYPSWVAGPKDVPPWEDDYSSVAYWYQRELVPPFDQLRGATYVGGTQVGQRPAVYHYRTDVFRDITGADLRTFGRAITGAMDAEMLLADVVRASRARIIDDALLPYEFNGELAVDFGQVDVGQVLGQVRLPVREANVYYPRLYFAPDGSCAEMTLEVNAERLDIVGRPEKGAVELTGIPLKKGVALARLIATQAGHGVLDCIVLRPAKRVRGAIEAEGVEVVRVSAGAHQPKPSATWPEASGGQVLQWQATGAGQSLVVNVDVKPDQPCILGVRPVLAPDAPVIQGYVDGKPAGPKFDLYAPKRTLSKGVLPLASWDGHTQQVQIRVVGRNPASKGWLVGVDYFRLEPVIIGPKTPPDIWAEVVATQGCRYGVQNLGSPGQWWKGHQLWVQPSRKGAYVDIAVHVPRAGIYDIMVRYTTSWDYAVVQAFVDGKPLGKPVDCYTPGVRLAEPLKLGRVKLSAGTHIVRFQAVDRNERSTGYLMGIDYISLRPAR